MKRHRFKILAIIALGAGVIVMFTFASPQSDLTITVTSKTTKASPNQVKGAMRREHLYFVTASSERFVTSAALFQRLQLHQQYAVRVRGWHSWLSTREIIAIEEIHPE